MIVALLWAAVVVFLYERSRPFVKQLVDLRCKAPVSSESIDLPTDLASFAANESEGWAQGEMFKAMRTLYEESKDWNIVRQSFGLGVTE